MLKPKKRFGQNFLKDPVVLQQMLHCVSPLTGEHIVEIGPGQGALTDYLLTSHADISAIEIDRDLIAQLQFKYLDDKHLHIIEGDALQFDFAALAQKGPIRIVGNLPYNISTPILFRLFKNLAQITDLHLLLQKEVVSRLCATPNSSSYGRLSVMTQFFCTAECLFDVPPTAFYPEPKVNSAYVRLTPTHQYPHVNPEKFATIVKACFAFRRKTLANCLKNILSADTLKQIDIDPTQRAQALPLEAFIRMTACLDDQ